MNKWEYKISRLCYHFEEYRLLRECDKQCDLLHNLEIMGAEGWEAMCITHIGNSRYECIFKRKRKTLWFI